MKHFVTNGTFKCRVNYYVSRDGEAEVVNIYSKSLLEKLAPIFGTRVRNDSDAHFDYFENDSVTIRKGDPLYEAAFEMAKLRKKKRSWNV